MIWDLRVETRSGDGHKLVETIHTTEEHPFRTVDGHWVPAAQLKAGTSLVTDAGSDVNVVSVARARHTAPTYNLEVADYHTYFVGNERVLVHNSCDPLSPNQMNRAVQRGQAPKGVGRTDVGKVKGEQQHTIIEGLGALNKNGTWKHGGGIISKAIAKWLRAQGYKIP